ncbi:MAG: MarR family winged helix-turn-helix transcriptional regulator [Actinomycetes bacterium]
MTRLVSRLEGQGLIVREPSDDNGRGRQAVLTDEGLRRLREATPAHVGSLRRHILDHLDGADLPIVAAALDRMAASGIDG